MLVSFLANKNQRKTFEKITIELIVLVIQLNKFVLKVFKGIISKLVNKYSTKIAVYETSILSTKREGITRNISDQIACVF